LGGLPVSTILWRFGRLVVGICVIVAITGVIGFRSPGFVPAASKQPASSSSLPLVLLNSTDGLPHYGQSVTFQVSTTATAQPNVSLDCYQGGSLVYGAVSGFYASYPWPGTQDFPLASPSWTGGPASCTASLYYFSGKKTVTLTTLNFQVYA
jgi:hypothetical protein